VPAGRALVERLDSAIDTEAELWIVFDQGEDPLVAQRGDAAVLDRVESQSSLARVDDEVTYPRCRHHTDELERSSSYESTSSQPRRHLTVTVMLTAATIAAHAAATVCGSFISRAP